MSKHCSLQDVECARMTRCAIQNSDLKFENVNYKKALRYIKIVGGNEHIMGIGLKRLNPKWRGKRESLISVGGEKSREDDMWRDSQREPTESEKKKIVAHVLEIAVLVAMSNHLYNFGGNTYIQASGGPIGMRATASLANVIMKLWDLAWQQIMNEEGIIMDLVMRYVDDCRVFMACLNEGWFWEDGTFKFSWDKRREDLEKKLSGEERTMREIVKAMCSLVPFLEFTGEIGEMFDNKRLPTLDVELWWSKNKKRIGYGYYEKPQVPNRVLMRDTALPVNTIRSSLIQEVVRRLQNCSDDVTMKERWEILSILARKMRNSGHSMKSTRIIIVQGVTKYVDNKRLHNLPKTHEDYRPM